MNDAHLHMLVNHFPIVGTIFGLGILIVAIVLNNSTAKNIAYSIFIVAALFAFFSMYTGEGAEEIVEDMPNIGHQIIHEHEEIAEKLAIGLYLLGIVSILGIYLNLKKHPKTKLLSYFILTISIIATVLATITGTTGGEIRHTEIRDNTTQTLEKLGEKENN
jgi:uncharacterized membrane protein